METLVYYIEPHISYTNTEIISVNLETFTVKALYTYRDQGIDGRVITNMNFKGGGCNHVSN
jgi:hypothetical protein